MTEDSGGNLFIPSKTFLNQIYGGCDIEDNDFFLYSTCMYLITHIFGTSPQKSVVGNLY